MSEVNRHLPGRLGNPDLTLPEDPRCDARIAEVLRAFGNFGGDIAPPAADAGIDEVRAYCAAFETEMAAQNDMLSAMLPSFDDITNREISITGVDGNEIPLLVSAPKDHPSSGPLPCIVHMHGGGMVIGSARDPNYILWRSTLASLGLVVVGVEFRNAAGNLGDHPFPAGLNDCANAVQWVDQNREELGISHIVLNGESGGGNLVLATALKAKQESWIDTISGVFSMCPYISGCYADPEASLLSLQENDDYTLNCQIMRAMVKAYDPEGVAGENPLAWPYQASIEDLSGLPPHYISVNELDPLRDEGLAYYRNLTRAGVSAVGRTVHGTPHAGDMVFPGVIDDVFQETVRAVYGFACAVGKASTGS